jgi:hypothetical protein
MEKLSIFPSNVPIPIRRIMIMNKLTTINNIREKLETRRNYPRKRKTFTPKKIVVHLTRVMMVRQSFYL